MMLGANWRIVVKNATGATSGAVSVKGKRWKPNSSGEYDPENTEQTFFSVSTITSGSYSTGSGVSNDAAGENYYGATMAVSITNGTSAGDYEVWLQTSTDGGTTWPNNGAGTLLGVFNVAASSTGTFDIKF